MSAYAAEQSGFVTVGAASVAVAPRNPGRREITLVNDHATNVLYVELASVDGVAPTAEVGSGIRLNAAGGSWTSNFFKGAIAAIASGAATNVTVTEF